MSSNHKGHLIDSRAVSKAREEVFT